MIRKAVSFALVGAVNALVDFTIFSVLRFYFGLPLLASNLGSWTVAVSGSFVMNSKFTFAAESGRRLQFRRYLTFVVSQIGGLIANTAAVFLFFHLLRPDGGVVGPLLSGRQAEMAAKILAIGVSFLVNFSLSHFVVFRGAPEPKEARQLR